MDKMQYLKRYYNLGFALLWLYPQSKRPIGDDWQKGDRKHWDTLKKTHKDAFNVGVRLGRASKLTDGTYLCVLDCDVKASEGHYLKEMQLALENFAPSVEYAPRVLSGRGGGSCHIYYRTEKPQQSFKALRSNHKVKVFMPSTAPTDADRKSGLSDEELAEGYRMRLAWEIDVYGEGKQVVLPPSIHPDTYAAYKWDTDLEELEHIPLVHNFVPAVQKVTANTKASKKIDYDYSLADAYDLSREQYLLITEGKGFDKKYPSRSEAVLGVLNALVFAGLSDEEINAVMTDEANFMSSKPLEAGKGNRERAAGWLAPQIAKVRASTSAANDFDLVADDIDVILTDAQAKAQEEELVPWASKLKGSEGAYKNTKYNITLILRHGFNERRIFGYNRFTQSILYMDTPAWGTEKDKGRELNDADITQVAIWLSKCWGIETGTHVVNEIVDVLAAENNFHPVQTYLDSLVWDGVPRLDTWLQVYTGAQGDDDYISAVGRKTLCAAVARIYVPGIKFDHMLILEGRQGVGKSSAVEILASKEWFSDSLGDITNKDIIEVMRGKWLIEVGELATMDRSSTNDMKNFITKVKDTHRKAFARRAVTVPRQSIFIGTTNDQEYLKDPTGGRRFWPVTVTKVDFKGLTRDRDQIIAEAKLTWELGEALYLEDKKTRQTAELEQYDRAVVDEIEAKVVSVIEEEDLEEQIDFTKFYDAFCFKYNSKELDYAVQNRCKKIFIRLGYKKVRYRTKDGARAYHWVKSMNYNKYKTY